MKLYLQRHAQAEYGEQMDPTRKLTPTGKRQARMMGKWLNRQVDKPDLVLQSNFHRSQSTAKRIAKRIDAPIVTTGKLDPDASPESAWREIRKQAALAGVQSIIAITHGPLVERITAMLIGAPSFSQIHFAHGAVAHFDTTRPITEAAGEYTYDEVEQKRWVLGSGGASGQNCEQCEENADLGWIDMDEVFQDTDGGDIDDAPAHPNCLVGDAVVSAAGVAAATKRWYKGEVVVLCCAGMNDLSVTPNHPILTRRGWVAAGELTLGDELAQIGSPRRSIALLNPHDNHIETSIEQILGALLGSRGVASAGVPISAKDFHGDGCVNGEVDIVRANGTLSRNAEWVRDLCDFRIDRSFPSGHSALGPFPGDGPLAQLFVAASSSADGIMRGLGLSRPLLRRKLGGSVETGLARVALLEPECFPSAHDGGSEDSRSDRESENAFASDVRFVQLLEVSRRHFAGHVYNLQTQDGFYSANTIIVHNCDCTVEQKTKRVRVYESGRQEAIYEDGPGAFFHWMVTPNTVARDEDEQDLVTEAALQLAAAAIEALPDETPVFSE